MKNLLKQFFEDSSEFLDMGPIQIQKLEAAFEAWLSNRELTFEEAVEPAVKFLQDRKTGVISRDKIEIAGDKAILFIGMRKPYTENEINWEAEKIAHFI